jgi:hypothetical protein
VNCLLKLDGSADDLDKNGESIYLASLITPSGSVVFLILALSLLICRRDSAGVDLIRLRDGDVEEERSSNSAVTGQFAGRIQDEHELIRGR